MSVEKNLNVIFFLSLSWLLKQCSTLNLSLPPAHTRRLHLSVILGAATFSMMTLSITTPSVRTLDAELCNTECRLLSVNADQVIGLNVIMLSVVILNVVMVSVVMLSVVMLIVVMLSLITLCVLMLIYQVLFMNTVIV
jgi:hypothetical protein